MYLMRHGVSKTALHQKANRIAVTCELCVESEERL